MNRKNFLRNCLMAAAISVLPKNLLPSMGEIEEDIYDGKRVNSLTFDEWWYQQKATDLAEMTTIYYKQSQ